MGTSTPRLQLYKPAIAGEVIDVKTAINDNLDRLDLATGTVICTSTTRPAAPFDGMMIKETDTKAIGVWDAASATWAMFDTVWQSYTPKFYCGTSEIGVTTGTLGNATVSGRYFRTGKTCRVRGGFLFGSTTSYGTASGSIALGVPFTGVSHGSNGWVGTTDAAFGQALITQGTTFWTCETIMNGGFVDRVCFRVVAAGTVGGGALNSYMLVSSVGVLNAAGQFVNFDGTYQVA